MLGQDRIQQASQFLLEEHSNRRPFGPIPAPCAPVSVADAYAIQDVFTAHLIGRQGPVAGYKIVLTTPEMQQFVGLQEPVAGVIFAQTIRDSPFAIRSADYLHLVMECEIAIQMGTTLPASHAPFGRDRVAQATGAVMVAVELLDDRHVNYSLLPDQVLSGIADNIWNVGIVLGVPISDWRLLDLAGVQGSLRVNGNVVAEGYGRAAMGNPLGALTWLANSLAGRGNNLDAGMIISTGNIAATELLQPGDAILAEIEGLGEVDIKVM